LIGASRAMTCAAEVPMFWYAGALIRKVGVTGVLALTCLCYIIRFSAYVNRYNCVFVCSF
jgi:hypothetical protein